MDVLGSASFILQNEALAQNRLATDVYALASGLRVRSASDDPSGYTIHETLDTKIAGLQQSVTNVQTASNLLQVANSALNDVQLILQRIRSLAVQANSDINSQNDLANIQSEIDQLLLEINRISANTNFNGLVLFNGQFAVSGSTQQNGTAIAETPAFPNIATGNTGSNTLVNGTGTGQSSPFMTIGQLTNGNFVPTFVVWSIVSASNNMVDPDTATPIGPGVLIQEVAYSVNGHTFGPTPEFIDYSAFPTNGGTIPSVAIVAPSNYPSAPPPSPGANGFIYNGVTFGNITAADVGAQAAFLTLLPPTPTTGHLLNVNDGGDEGQTVGINLPELDTNALNITGISVLEPDVTTVQSITQTLQYPGLVSNNMAASYTEIVVDRAIQTIAGVQAQVGAQTVALQQDADSDSVTIVNETAASSNIRDADIGATVTDFTKQQILVNVGNSVLSQIEVNAQQLTALLLNSFSGLGAAQGQQTTIPGGGQGSIG